MIRVINLKEGDVGRGFKKDAPCVVTEPGGRTGFSYNHDNGEWDEWDERGTYLAVMAEETAVPNPPLEKHVLYIYILGDKTGLLAISN